MMKKYLLIFCLLVFAAGCSKPVEKQNVIIKINDYEITQQEFEQEFKDSGFASTDTPEARTELLNSIINRQLILSEAQEKGLDKDKSFLRMIERFWAQSLLKLALDRKSKEIAGTTVVNDAAVRNAYENLVKEGKTDKTYDQMYNQIKWEITKLKEAQAMNRWLEGLRNKAQIDINYDVLKKSK